MKKNNNSTQNQKSTQKQGLNRREVGRESGYHENDKNKTIGLGKDLHKTPREESRK